MPSRYKTGTMSSEELYWLSYISGFHIGTLSVLREMILNCVTEKCRLQKLPINRDLVKTINRETDRGYLRKLLYLSLIPELPVIVIEMAYLSLVFTPAESIKYREYLPEL